MLILEPHTIGKHRKNWKIATGKTQLLFLDFQERFWMNSIFPYICSNIWNQSKYQNNIYTWFVDFYLFFLEITIPVSIKKSAQSISLSIVYNWTIKTLQLWI